MSDKPVIISMIVSTMLFISACSGGNSESEIENRTVDDTLPIHDKISAVCETTYNPVCAASKQDSDCSTISCSDEIHASFSNQCQADLVDAITLFEGECDELEGEPVDPEICTLEYSPVCGAATQVEVCETIPCPSLRHKTFPNMCKLDVAEATYLFGGDCGAKEDQAVYDAPNSACTKEYVPVCAKDESSLECTTTEPCPTHEYKTFSNSCDAENSLASIAFTGECNTLENTAVFGQPPVIIVEPEAMPKVEKVINVIYSSIESDILTVELEYGGCGSQHFDLYIDNFFMESNPVQATAKFSPQVEDYCKALIRSEHNYDLTPLKEIYYKYYGELNSTIILRDLGEYIF